MDLNPDIAALLNTYLVLLIVLWILLQTFDGSMELALKDIFSRARTRVHANKVR